jgi:DNA-binding response OmpR family regulator
MSASIFIVANPYDATNIRHILSREGLAVEVFGTVSELSRRVEEDEPDLLILAGNLLRASVSDLAANVRSGGYGASVAILLVGHIDGQAETEAQAKEIGVNHYLCGSLESTLVAKVREVCGEIQPSADPGVDLGPSAAISAFPTRLEKENGTGNDETGSVGPQDEVREFTTNRQRRSRSGSTAGWTNRDEGTLARELMLELKAADERLFPDSRSPLSLFSWQNYPSVVSERRESEEVATGNNGEIDGFVTHTTSQRVDTVSEEVPADEAEVVEEIPPVEVRRASRPTLEQNRTSSERIPQTGDLRTVPVATLYWHAVSQRLNCRLIFRRGEKETTFFLLNGGIVGADSTCPDDGLARQLVQQGKIDQRHTVDLDQNSISAAEVAQVLVDRDLIKRDEVACMLRDRCLNIVYSVFGWHEGLYQIQLNIASDSFSEAEHHDIGLSPLEILWEGIRRKMGLEQLRILLGGKERAVRLNDPEEQGVACPALDEEEKAVLAALKQPKRIAALEALADPLKVNHMIYALHTTGTVTLDGGGGGLVRSRGERELAIERQRIAIKYAQVRESDYFALLGLKHDASRHEVMRAYTALREDFHPQSFARQIRGESEAELKSIEAVLVEAYRILHDDELREAYRASMGNGR